MVQNHLRLKDELLEEALLLRKQQLYDAEKDQLYKALSLFPGDIDILNEIRTFNERHALEVLQKKARHKSELKSLTQSENQLLNERPSQELLDGLKHSSQNNPDLAYDFAIVALSIDQPALAFDILQYAPDSKSKTWLLLEVLLLEKKYLELLSQLPPLKVKFADDPESPYAISYLEAQALWGLGQKEKAKNLMENLLQAKPHYRFGESLLFLWRTEA